MLPDAVTSDPAGLALDDLTRTRSWAELGDRATRAGRLLRETYGIEPGGHAAMIMGNRVEFIELTLGALIAGVWITPINWHLTAEEAAYIVTDSESSLVIADPMFEAVAREAAGGLPVLVAGDELDAPLAAASAEPFGDDDVAGGPVPFTPRPARPPKGGEGATHPTPPPHA